MLPKYCKCCKDKLLIRFDEAICNKCRMCLYS